MTDMLICAIIVHIFHFTLGYGSWAIWSSWSSCSVSCDSGVQGRSRLCIDPTPDLFGAKCRGSNTQKRTCHTGDHCYTNTDSTNSGTGNTHVSQVIHMWHS